MTKKQSILPTLFAALACSGCGGSAENAGKSMTNTAAGGAIGQSSGGNGGGAVAGQGGRGGGGGGTAGTGGFVNPCPQSSWVVETCLTPEAAWTQVPGTGGMANTAGSGGAPPEAGAAGDPHGGEGGAARDECPVLPLYPHYFMSFGPVVKDGQCCYGYTQICG